MVSVILPAMGGAESLADCLVSLLRMDYPPDRREIFLVDNGLSAETAEMARRHPVRYLREGRRGISYARNRGIEASTGEVLAFTDPDCAVSTGWLRELVQPFRKERVGGVAGAILPYPGSTALERYAARRRSHTQERPISHPVRPFAMTPNVAFRREVFQRIGFFDTRFPGGGWEDADLCWRFFTATDLELAYAPKAVVFHRYRATAKDFLIQHFRYGQGLALIYGKYRRELSWGWRQRLGAYRELGTATAALGGTALRHAMGSTAPGLDTAYFDFLRQLGQRIGFLRGAVRSRSYSA